MSIPLIYDVIIIAVAVYFIFRGWWLGLVLTLSSLVILICASFGAGLVSDALTPTASQMVSPFVESYLKERLSAQTDPSATVETLLSEGNLALLSPYIDDEVVAMAQDAGSEIASEAVQGIALVLSQGLVSVALWLIAFALISIVLHMVARALDLVAKLPLLRTVNALGGIGAGAVQGVLVIYIGLAIFGFFDLLLSAEVAAQTKVYSFFIEHSLLSLVL